MAKCTVCGKRGLFLRVNDDGLCADCEARWQAKLAEERRQKALQEKLDEERRQDALQKKRAKEAEERQMKEENEKKTGSIDVASIPLNINVTYGGRTESGPITTSYRSPLAAARRGLFYCEGEPNLYNISDDDFRLVIFLMYFAGWQVTEDNRGSYDMKMLFPHPLTMFDDLLHRGWIVPPDPAVSLSHMTVPKLKEFAAEHGVSLKSSKKSDIIACILENAPASDLNDYAASNWYAELTAQGFHMLRSLYNERIDVMLRVSRLVQTGNTKAADLVAAAYWHKRAILTHPSIIPDIPPFTSFSPIEATVITAKTYFMGDDLIKIFMDYWGEHEDVVMHRGILEYLLQDKL